MPQGQNYFYPYSLDWVTAWRQMQLATERYGLRATHKQTPAHQFFRGPLYCQRQSVRPDFCVCFQGRYFAGTSKTSDLGDWYYLHSSTRDQTAVEPHP